jgi:hypothetical protein
VEFAASVIAIYQSNDGPSDRQILAIQGLGQLV